MSKKYLVCMLAACPAFALLSAGCGDSDVAMDPIASGGASAAGDSAAGDSAAGDSAAGDSGGSRAAAGGVAGQQGEQTASNAGAGAGGAPAGAGGQVDGPRDAGALGLAPVQLGDAVAGDLTMAASGVNLTEQEKRDAESRKHPRAQVLYEAIRIEGEYELGRPAAALAWSGLAAGLSMGFSLVAMGISSRALPEA